MASGNDISAVVFDLDDTLYAERDYVYSGYGAVADYLRKTADRDEDFRSWLWERFLAGRYGGAFDELNDYFALDLSDGRITELVSVYRGHEPDIHPGEGIGELLENLHGKFRLGIVSDGFLPAQQLKLNSLALERFFDAVVFTESLGRDAWKPSPAGFEAIAEKLNVSHEACVYIADNPSKDFVAPNALGWRTIQYCFSSQIHSHKTPPEGGKAQVVADSAQRILQILNT